MKIDRLIGILTILLQKEKTTTAELAERFEVSRRTILRDIDALCRAGIPLVTAQGGNGGISIMEGYKINKNVLTTEEWQDLAAALRGLDSISRGSGFEQLTAKLMPESVSAVFWADRMSIDLSSYYKDSLSEKITLLKQAIAEKRIVRFDYYYSKGTTHRRVEPHCIEFQWNSWYLFGWCCDREDFRRFKLNRLWQLELTAEPFTLREGAVEKARLVDVFPPRFHMEILFDKRVRFRLVEEYGLCCYEETEEGLRFSLDYSDAEYTFEWLRSFGDKAVILSPEEARRDFVIEAQKMVERYRET